MCTVSLIPPSLGRGLRLVFNRDERRTRPVAWAPQLAHSGGVPVIAPVDSESLGTWVAASGAGLVYALLNLNQGDQLMPRVARASRGRVIPAVAGSDNLHQATRRLGALDVEQFGPFHLVITDGFASATCQWNGELLELATCQLRQPIIVSSSSLGDDLVEGPRRALFDDLLATDADPWRAQDRLHQHAWPDRRHLSVLMTRAAARTVGRTIIVMEHDGATMSYSPVIDGWIGPSTETRVARLGIPLAEAG